MSAEEHYPDAWKIACLAFLRAKREELRRSVGHKRLGWDAVRHLIMEPYDAENRGIASDLLNASTLDAWDRRPDGASISDGKFKFIDQYIRRVAATEGNASAVELLRSQRFRDYARSLLLIYNPNLLLNGEIEQEPSLPKWAHRSRLTETISEADSRIAIKFLDSCKGALHLVCAIMPSSFRSLSGIDPRRLSFYEGVMVAVNANGWGEYEGQSSFYLARLLKDGFRGLHPAGYADGELYLRFEAGNEREAHLELRAPSSWFSPKEFFAEALPRKSATFPMSVNSRTESRSNECSTIKLVDPTAIIKLGQSGSELWDRESAFVDNIFDNYYRGYADL